jgi:hypothetical protein
MQYYEDVGLGGVEVKLHTFFTLGLKGHEKIGSCPSCFMQDKFDRRMGELQSWFECHGDEKNSIPCLE